MAKGIGLIGNFKGKVGNTVGYKLTTSNNGQTQGIRVYQPIVKNPKSAGQAEQRAKLLAVNATYRALKMIIDRGNEGLPYGNKSRLAWLKGALKAERMPWFEKGSIANYPVVCQLTKGSLGGFTYTVTEDELQIVVSGVTTSSEVDTIGKVSTLMLAGCPNVKAGDQVTVVVIGNEKAGMNTEVFSFVIDATSTVNTDKFTADANKLTFNAASGFGIAAVILSRQGDNGEHLRSNASLIIDSSWTANMPYNDESKAAAIASYRASAASNSDWAEESIQ
jgi:hypothetical protein